MRMDNVTIFNKIVPHVTAEDMNRDMVEKIMPVIVFIGLLAVLGLFGNLIVIFIYSKRYPRCNFKYFVLILAGIDMVSCSILMPLEIFTFAHWLIFPSAGLCKFKSALNVYTVTASASCLLLIAVDRFRKVCQPHGKQITPNLALKLTAVALSLSTIPAASDAVLWGLHTYSVKYEETNLTLYLCEKDDLYKDTLWPKLHTTILYTGSNVIVMASTLLLYILIARKLFLKSTPVLTPEITVSSPDTAEGPLTCNSESQTQRDTMQSISDIETGFTESDISNNSIGFVCENDVNEESDCAISVAQPNKEVRLRDSLGIRSDTKMTKISHETNEDTEEAKLAFLKIPDVAMRPKISIPASKSSGTGSNDLYRRRRSTLHSLRGHAGTKLRRKTLIMFVLTVIFIVTTVAYLAMISHMADSSDFIESLTITEKVVWLFFLRLYFINSFINPLLYGFLDTRFRRKLWDMGIHFTWLAGSLRRNIGESIRRTDSGRTNNPVVRRPSKDIKYRPKSSSTMSY